MKRRTTGCTYFMFCLWSAIRVARSRDKAKPPRRLWPCLISGNPAIVDQRPHPQKETRPWHWPAGYGRCTGVCRLISRFYYKIAAGLLPCMYFNAQFLRCLIVQSKSSKHRCRFVALNGHLKKIGLHPLPMTQVGNSRLIIRFYLVKTNRG